MTSGFQAMLVSSLAGPYERSLISGHQRLYELGHWGDHDGTPKMGAVEAMDVSWPAVPVLSRRKTWLQCSESITRSSTSRPYSNFYWVQAISDAGGGRRVGSGGDAGCGMNSAGPGRDWGPHQTR
mgnify:CR=1 FL=1